MFQNSFQNIEGQKHYRNFGGDGLELWPSILLILPCFGGRFGQEVKMIFIVSWIRLKYKISIFVKVYYFDDYRSKIQQEDQWSSIAHLSAADLLNENKLEIRGVINKFRQPC